MNKTTTRPTPFVTGLFAFGTIAFAGLAGAALLETRSPTVCASGHAIYAGLTLWSTFLSGTCLNTALDGVARLRRPLAQPAAAGITVI